MTTVSASRQASAAAESAPAFRQALGLFDSIMLVTGTIIGSGIFIVSAQIAREVGSAGWLMAVWAITGLMTIAGALCYAELAAMMPHAGGQYVFLREAYSPLWGFLYGWTLFMVIQTGSIAAVGVAFAKFFGVLVPQLGTENVLFRIPNLNIHLTLHLPWMAKSLTVFKREEFTVSAGQLVGTAVIIFLTLLNCRGVRHGKWVQNIFTVGKVSALLALLALGLTVAANPQAIAANTRDLWSAIRTTQRHDEVRELLPTLFEVAAIPMVIGAAMVGSLFSADAWNNLTFTAAEVKNPRRTLPLGLALGSSLVIAIYLLTNLAYTAVLPVQGDAALAERLKQRAAAAETRTAKAAVERNYVEATAALGISHARDDRVATAVMQQMAPGIGPTLMALAIMVSTFGSINGMILMGARLYYAMARDGLFFESAGWLNTRGVPAVGLVLQGLWSVLLVFSGTYNELLDYVIFAALLFYFLTVVGLFILRRTRPDAERPYRVTGYPMLPVAYVLLCGFIMLDLLVVKPGFTWPGLILVVAGVPVYVIWRLRGRRRTLQPARSP